MTISNVVIFDKLLPFGVCVRSEAVLIVAVCMSSSPSFFSSSASSSSSCFSFHISQMVGFPFFICFVAELACLC